MAGSGSRRLKFAHNQKNAVLELSNPDIAPMVRGLQTCDETPAPNIDSIIIAQVMVSMVANTRPRNSSGTCRSNWEVLRTELMAMAARDNARNIIAQAKDGIWLNATYDPPWIT